MCTAQPSIPITDMSELVPTFTKGFLMQYSGKDVSYLCHFRVLCFPLHIEMEKEVAERKQSLNELAIIKTNAFSADVVFLSFLITTASFTTINPPYSGGSLWVRTHPLY